VLAKGEVQRHDLQAPENWRILLPSEMMSEETILSIIEPYLGSKHQKKRPKYKVSKTYQRHTRKLRRPVTCSVGLNLVGGLLKKQ